MRKWVNPSLWNLKGVFGSTTITLQYLFFFCQQARVVWNLSRTFRELLQSKNQSKVSEEQFPNPQFVNISKICIQPKHSPSDPLERAPLRTALRATSSAHKHVCPVLRKDAFARKRSASGAAQRFKNVVAKVFVKMFVKVNKVNKQQIYLYKHI